MNVYEKQVGLELNGTHQLLVYAGFADLERHHDIKIPISLNLLFAHMRSK
jgi:hypothetical protein